MSEALSASYQGFSISKDESNNKTIQGFVGFKEQCLDYISDVSIGMSGEFGYLESIDLAQKDGPFWEVKLGWDGNERGIQINPGGTGPQQSSLNMRMLSLPLEKATLYRTHWNYSLACLSGEDIIPDFWWDATNTKLSGSFMGKYKWIKEPSELPPADENSVPWIIAQTKTKPGVESYDYPVYEITESSKYSNKNKARMGYFE